MSGRLHFVAENYPSDRLSPASNFQDNLTVQFESRSVLNPHWQFRFEPDLRVSSRGELSEVPLDLNSRDTQFEAKFETLRLQLGSFTKVWEGPDGYNPMDIASMKDYRDPLAPEVLGSLGATIAGGEGHFTWDFLYVPYQTSSRWPGAQSRWLPRRTGLPLETRDVGVVVPDQPLYQVGSHESLNEALRNNVGGRMQVHLGASDFSLAGFEGAAQVPLLRATLEGDLVQLSPKLIIKLKNPIQIQPVDYRRRTLAFGWTSSAIDTWVLRLAGRHDQPLGENLLLPSWSQQWVGGIEKSVTLFDQQSVFSLQYAYGAKPETPPGPLSIQDPFQSTLLYGARIPVSETLLFSYAGLWEHVHGTTYQRLHGEKKIGEHWVVDAGADLISGPPDSLMGLWADEQRISLGAQFQF